MSERSAINEIPGFEDFLDGLAKKLAEIPKSPVFASSWMFPAKHAWKFSHDSRDYLLAHPDFWANVPADVKQGDPGLWAIEIVNIDAEPEHPRRREIMDAIADFLATPTEQKDPPHAAA